MSQVRSCPDDTYWNEKATELAYLAELRNSGTATSPRLDQKTLHERAIATVGAVDFDELLLELGIDASYTSLTQAQIAAAVGMGILGVLLTVYTNGKSKGLTEFFEKIHGHYKADSGCSPLDYRAGKNHRYIFGHDGNLWQHLPEGYTYNGSSVGGRSLYSLVMEQMRQGFPNSSFIGGHVKAILHIATHYLSDLPTKDGLPLPFSSLFTQWVKDETKVSGYSANNPLMDKVGKEFGTINAADIASYAIIKTLLAGHHWITFYSTNASEDEKKLHHAQMSVIAYGTAMIIQMALLCSGQAGRTGKLNYLIAGPFLWNAGKSVLMTQRHHRDLVLSYRDSCAILDNKSLAFDHWVKHQCV
ncbi:hypothetical protein [Novosphingobium sp. MBES04]|uniref:hypothetical protein n=1 Tax=Novosphingobium sp. MBES04 TaxID=1206458 RepID=UPI0011858032|nr:hypothetical protein [Novosphingobium sp. MBES04]